MTSWTCKDSGSKGATSWTLIEFLQASVCPLLENKKCSRMTSDDLHFLTHAGVHGWLSSCTPIHSLDESVAHRRPKSEKTSHRMAATAKTLRETIVSNGNGGLVFAGSSNLSWDARIVVSLQHALRQLRDLFLIHRTMCFLQGNQYNGPKTTKNEHRPRCFRSG
jgi:hypothetical protein